MRKILIVDFVSDFSVLISNLLEKLNIDYVIKNHDLVVDDLEKDLMGIILSGSRDCVFEGGRQVDKALLELNIPILGICYGQQLANLLFDGVVTKAEKKEYDEIVDFYIDVDNPIFNNVSNPSKVAMFHYDEVIKLGEGFISLGHTANCKYAATYNEEKKIYTVQFHPEHENSQYSKTIFENFINICKSQD